MMSTNQRSCQLFMRERGQGRSPSRQLVYLTPKFNRRLPSTNTPRKQTSTSKFKQTHRQRTESQRSQELPPPKLQHHWISLHSKPQLAAQKHPKEDLRETDDSVRPLRSRKLTINSFQIIKLLGKGKHGTVFLAIHRDTGFIGALKVFNKQQLLPPKEAERTKLQEELIRQLKIQSFIDHTHIIKLYSVFSDKDYIYAFMEVGSDGQLYQVFQKNKQLKEETISFVNRSLLEALQYLHGMGIIHRDVKPENVVLIHGFPKICDFGQSNFFSKEKGELRETLCGTPLYLSPEILMGDKYDQKIDIWALGAMAYELFTGENPFNIKNKDELKKIVTEEFRMSKGSIQICNFLTHCLKKNPLQRPTSSKLLKHPFIMKWKQLQTAQELCSHSQH